MPASLRVSHFEFKKRKFAFFCAATDDRTLLDCLTCRIMQDALVQPGSARQFAAPVIDPNKEYHIEDAHQQLGTG
ncbi:hypothetical protein RRG08_024434 [Elysia crispata]|uniref:Uncharacterized protein n=1 Tax=Elysia crispata TaxID=231223 RepID=A0AAE0YPJ6_9GAST|nr:hypothetical protein RRG08_024434 [Elysia crispata]